MISRKRLYYLDWSWNSETDDPETQEWRKELNAEEAAVVASWDEAFKSKQLP